MPDASEGHDATGRHPPQIHDPQAGVQPGDQDRERHAEGMDRGCPGDEERLVGGERRRPDEPAGAFARPVRHATPKRESPRSREDHVAHPRTLARAADAAGLRYWDARGRDHARGTPVTDVRVRSVVIDCNDLGRMMSFWRGVLHFVPRDEPEGDWVVLRDPAGRA